MEPCQPRVRGVRFSWLIESPLKTGAICDNGNGVT